MILHNERHVDLTAYTPLPEDEEGLTPYQIQERRVSVRRVALLRYDADMNRQNAEAVLALPATAIMQQLELDEEQARCYLERLEMAGARQENKPCFTGPRQTIKNLTDWADF